jgi:plasmid stability protein
MNPIILDDLDVNILEWLQNRAEKHGNTLQAEVKLILEELKQTITEEVKSDEHEIIKHKADLMLQQIQNHATSIHKNNSENINQINQNSTSYHPEELLAIRGKLQELKKGISLNNLSIREARELGREF